MPDEDKREQAEAETAKKLAEMSAEEEPETEEETEPEEKKETSRTEEFDADILGLAKEFGLSEAEAKSFGTVSSLEKALYLMANREEKAGKPEDNGEKPKPFDLKVEAGEDEEEDELLKKINAALGKAAETIRNQSESIEQLQAQAKQTQAAMFISRADAVMARHGGDYREEFGEGDFWDISPGSKEAENRAKVYEEMDAIIQVNAFRKRQMSDKQLFLAAVANVFGSEKPKAKAKAELEERIAKRRGSFIRRAPGASDRDTKLTGKELARQKTREKMAELGMLPGQ